MSKRAKYKYDPLTLQYQKIEMDWKEISKRILKYGGVGLVIAGIIILISFPFIKDFANRRHQKDIDFLNSKFESMDAVMDTALLVLNELQERDNNVYRVIYSAEPFTKDKIVKQYVFGKKTHEEYVYDLNEKLKYLTKNIVDQSKSFDELIELAVNKEKMIMSVPSILPIEDEELTRLSSGFGWRDDPVYHVQKMHTGLDFTAPTGSKIHCSGEGVVEVMEYNSGGYGKHIIINHGYGYKSHYAHLSEFKTRKGKRVKRGEVIGLVGSTGKSTAPHLHYEIIKNGNKINPIHFFFNDLNPEQYQEMLEKSKQTGASLD